jgi:hypothetical protein
MSQPDTSVRDSWSELKVLSRASQVRTAQGPFFPLIPGLWRPATFCKALTWLGSFLAVQELKRPLVRASVWRVVTNPVP